MSTQGISHEDIDHRGALREGSAFRISPLYSHIEAFARQWRPQRAQTRLKRLYLEAYNRVPLSSPHWGRFDLRHDGHRRKLMNHIEHFATTVHPFDDERYHDDDNRIRARRYFTRRLTPNQIKEWNAHHWPFQGQDHEPWVPTDISELRRRNAEAQRLARLEENAREAAEAQMLADIDSGEIDPLGDWLESIRPIIEAAEKENKTRKRRRYRSIYHAMRRRPTRRSHGDWTRDRPRRRRPRSIYHAMRVRR